MNLHRHLKAAFDPRGIFNPGRQSDTQAEAFCERWKPISPISSATRRAGREAEAILRKCVHCGFCTATCPTYQLLGDELDGPRGRIYLIKQVLEGVPPTEKTRLHLDRCLTCRSCETTCPSGVHYSRLLDIGRALVEERVPRQGVDAVLRGTLREVLAASGAVRHGDEARPDGASLAAGGVEGQGAAAVFGGKPAVAPLRPAARRAR